MEITVQAIADFLGGKVEGDKDAIIKAPSKIEEGTPGTITFLGNEKYEEYVYDTQATAVIVSDSFSPQKEINTTLIKVEDVYGSLGKLLEKFGSKEVNEYHISSSAFIDPSAVIHEKVNIGNGVFIGKGSEVGGGSYIMPQVYIGEQVKIGKNVKLFPGVRIYQECIIGDNTVIHSNSVIGSDGFGFSKDAEGNYKKIPQLGNVVIEEDVEIGSNTTIDRATIGSTIIRKGVKLDNLIQIGHNVEIGESTVIAAQTGVAGSTKIGKHCLIGGQVGIIGHITIADGTMIQAQSGVGKKVRKAGSKLYGSPAIDYGNYLKSYAVFKSLPNIVNEIQELREQIANLEADQK